MDLSILRSESPRYDDSVSAVQNQLGSVLLKNVPIVSLLIDGKERLCLAQISNTLLRDFTYNEIHNRRVALGITCIQCTPVQLEILRRAGAMPVSSRRCGMITKREAERLIKSFLEEAAPPQLPENFSFDVYHECGWGCQGKFVPARYNSSRAKCIKCVFCNIFFSPNKFIFHCHKLPTSLYRHPDAANFNSWRRHLKLHTTNPDNELMYAWEDVKAMFNGGSRRKVVDSNTVRDEPGTKIRKLEETISSEPFQFPAFNNNISNSYDMLRHFPSLRPTVTPIISPDWSKYNDLLRMRAMSGQYPYFWQRDSNTQSDMMLCSPLLHQKPVTPVKKSTNPPQIWRGFLDDDRKSPKTENTDDGVIQRPADGEIQDLSKEKCSRKSKPRKYEIDVENGRSSDDEEPRAQNDTEMSREINVNAVNINLSKSNHQNDDVEV